MLDTRVGSIMNEKELSLILQQDFSIGTERFCESLLQRCLSILRSSEEGRDVSDDELELLAAAGSPFILREECDD